MALHAKYLREILQVAGWLPARRQVQRAYRLNVALLKYSGSAKLWYERHAFVFRVQSLHSQIVFRTLLMRKPSVCRTVAARYGGLSKHSAVHLYHFAPATAINKPTQYLC